MKFPLLEILGGGGGYSLPLSHRIASLVWGSSAAYATFPLSIMRESLPTDLLLLIVVMLVLQKGSMEELAAFGNYSDETIELLAENYSYLGIDGRRESFKTILLRVPDLAVAFASVSDALAAKSLFPDGDAFGVHLADALVVKQSFERACEIARFFISRVSRALWLAARGNDLLNGECFKPASDVYQSLGGERAGRERELDAAEAQRQILIADTSSVRIETTCAFLNNGDTSVPMLTVNLFGGFDVRIGDRSVEASQFRRRKVKILLALLVLNRGREYSRDRLVGMLWPESDLFAARKNFYSIWSMLRRALSTLDGRCPYLVREQHSLRIDSSLLESDVMAFDAVCRKLLFENPGPNGWVHLFSQINDLFSEELLPSEGGNRALDAFRLDCKSRLIDALVAASSRLVDMENVQEGLWFARAALKQDEAREDVYRALMRAQLAAGQRTAALDTYFACRKYLAEELGIDPSGEVVRLYRSIIESEEMLD